MSFKSVFKECCIDEYVQIRDRRSIAKEHRKLYKSNCKKCRPEHLSYASHINVQIKCPKCGKVRKVEYQTCTRSKKFTGVCTKCSKSKNLIARVFGRLTVIELFDVINNYNYWTCLCICGTITIVKSSSLINGHTRSCGCLQKEMAKNSLINLHKQKEHWITSEHSSFENLQHFSSLKYLYNSSQWKKLREKILQKSPTCLKCGATTSLVVHHLCTVKDSPELALDDKNLVVLCNKCHALYHTTNSIISSKTFYNWLD